MRGECLFTLDVVRRHHVSCLKHLHETRGVSQTFRAGRTKNSTSGRKDSWMNVSTVGERSQQKPYLSRRRNTTGSISLKKILDLNNDASGGAFKLSSFSALNQSTEKISPESKAFFSSFSCKRTRSTRSVPVHRRVRSASSQNAH